MKNKNISPEADRVPEYHKLSESNSIMIIDDSNKIAEGIINLAYNPACSMSLDGCLNFSVSQEQLQEAFIWSEILQNPICKRRKRRYYGN